jgi:hypothetical protein
MLILTSLLTQIRERGCNNWEPVTGSWCLVPGGRSGAANPEAAGQPVYRIDGTSGKVRISAYSFITLAGTRLFTGPQDARRRSKAEGVTHGLHRAIRRARL